MNISVPPVEGVEQVPPPNFDILDEDGNISIPFVCREAVEYLQNALNRSSPLRTDGDCVDLKSKDQTSTPFSVKSDQPFMVYNDESGFLPCKKEARGILHAISTTEMVPVNGRSVYAAWCELITRMPSEFLMAESTIHAKARNAGTMIDRYLVIDRSISCFCSNSSGSFSNVGHVGMTMTMEISVFKGTNMHFVPNYLVVRKDRYQLLKENG